MPRRVNAMSKVVDQITARALGPGGTGFPTLIFDFDGTIADTLSAIIKLVNSHADEFHIRPLEDEDVEALRGMTNREIIKKYNIPLVKIPRLILRSQKELHEHIDGVPVFPGIRELIVDLKRHGFRLGILTTNATKNVKTFLLAHDLDVFDFIHTETNIFGKSRALLHLFKKHHLESNTVVYVGDEIRDIEACLKVGVAIIAVSWGFHRRKLLLDHQPTYLVDSPGEIKRIVMN